MKGNTDKPTISVEFFSTAHSVIDRTSKQKIEKEIKELKLLSINTDIYQALHTK